MVSDVLAVFLHDVVQVLTPPMLGRCGAANKTLLKVNSINTPPLALFYRIASIQQCQTNLFSIISLTLEP